MKTISLRQPWAYLLCAGVKNIENRTWKLPEKYKGETVLIHTSADRSLNLKALTKEQYADVCDKFTWDATTKPVDQWERSAIIGSVRFVDCVINHPSIWAEKDRWLDKTTYNWVATDAVLFDKPILNVKGKLGFWDYQMTEEEYNNLANIGL